MLKDYIDDLIFALYFNIHIEKVRVERAEVVKSACKKNKFYRTIDSLYSKKD